MVRERSRTIINYMTSYMVDPFVIMSTRLNKIYKDLNLLHTVLVKPKPNWEGYQRKQWKVARDRLSGQADVKKCPSAAPNHWRMIIRRVCPFICNCNFTFYDIFWWIPHGYTVAVPDFFLSGHLSSFVRSFAFTTNKRKCSAWERGRVERESDRRERLRER